MPKFETLNDLLYLDHVLLYKRLPSSSSFDRVCVLYMYSVLHMYYRGKMGLSPLDLWSNTLC